MKWVCTILLVFWASVFAQVSEIEISEPVRKVMPGFFDFYVIREVKQQEENGVCTVTAKCLVRPNRTVLMDDKEEIRPGRAIEVPLKLTYLHEGSFYKLKSLEHEFLRYGEPKAGSDKQQPTEPAPIQPDPPPKQSQLETPKIVEESAKSVALITIPGPAWGSGFLVSHGGRIYIATNVHVAACDADLKDISIDFEGGQHCAATGILFSDKNDIALLLPDKELSLPPLALAVDCPLRNTPVFAIGNSEGKAVNRILPGKVIGLGSKDGVKTVENDTEFVGGNSGGPLLTSDGKVVGVNTWVENPTSPEKQPTVRGTSFSKKGRRISQFISVLEIATDSEWTNLRRCAADYRARVRILVLCERIFLPNQAFWNSTVNLDAAKNTVSGYVSKEIAEIPRLLAEVIGSHDNLVKTRLAFLNAYREAYNALRLGRPMDFPLKSLAFNENELRKEGVKLQKAAGELVQSLEQEGKTHPALCKGDDPLKLKEGAALISQWFTQKNNPLALEYEEIQKRIAEINGKVNYSKEKKK